jgi:hypothetical protein
VVASLGDGRNQAANTAEFRHEQRLHLWLMGCWVMARNKSTTTTDNRRHCRGKCLRCPDHNHHLQPATSNNVCCNKTLQPHQALCQVSLSNILLFQFVNRLRRCRNNFVEHILGLRDVRECFFQICFGAAVINGSDAIPYGAQRYQPLTRKA